MRIIVFSDSHRNRSVLESIVLAHPEAGVFLHLGDGEREFLELAGLYPDKIMLGVAGNGDWCSHAKDIDVFIADKKKIVFTHGHTFGVKAGTDEFLRAAKNLGADIALYGHTHVARTDYEEGMFVMNPGSVSLPQQGPPSYGMIDVTPAGVVTNIVTFSGR